MMDDNFYDGILSNSSNSTIRHPNCKIIYEAGVFLILANVFTSLLGTLGNVLVWIAFFKKPNLRTVTNYFLVNLAFADLLVTLLAQPLFCVRLQHTIENSCRKDIRISYKSASSLSCFASIATLACVSVDRFISLRNPLNYRNIVTKARAIAMICVVWMSALSYNSVLYANNFKETDIWKAVTVSSFLICYVTICVMHCCMYVITRRFIRRVYGTHEQTPDVQKIEEVYKREKKAAKTVALVFLLFSISWLPYIVQTFVKGVAQLRVAREISYPLFTLALMNSSVNPILYSFRNKEFKNAVEKMFRRGTRVGVYQPRLA